MIIGTAGHIDHGKTTLVKALTGINTDTLKDEQKRGITISLGYAYQPLNEQLTLGFVDVPGHEGLIHTMVAGATGIDFAMLVVAADDGVMPQTLEHIAILSLLGLSCGCVVITRSALAQPEQLARTQQQLQQALAGTFLDGAPQFVTDSLSGDGIAPLREFLQQQAEQQQAVSDAGPFRLAIDRAFTLSGQGTVVTGTVYDGHFSLHSKHQHLRLMPANIPVRVRGLHAQNQAGTQARAGQRCAFNLANIAKDAIARGDWLAEAGCFEPGPRLDVELQLLSTSAPLGTWTPLHVHIGAAHVMAHLVPLQATTVQAGKPALAQLVFEQPLCALPGDRFIIRNAQAKQTLGGGRVLDANGPDRKRRTPARLAWLKAVADYLDQKNVLSLLQQAPYGITRTALHRLAGQAPEQIMLPKQALWLTPTGKNEPVLMHEAHWQPLLSRIEATLKKAHESYPDEPGIEAARLRRMTDSAIPQPLWHCALQTLLEQQRLALTGAWYHLPGHSVSLSESEQALAGRMLALSYDGRYDPPWVRDLAATLEAGEEEIRQLGRKLVRQGLLYQVQPDLLYHHQHVEQLAALLRQHAPAEGIKAAELRDRLGLGRKRTLQILEFFQRIGYSRRRKDRHVIRADNMMFTSPPNVGNVNDTFGK
ncbi:selenocysteine-specific translation elongation factor [Oceanimonas smirnovii]|uniref:selenocysteine-specific translation elongation factor n=1 Tax=Oceanimonas smirnovii TaxID=264574 RepID=UPI0003AA98EE|nr:selenocysteine-specific translation elongation factor [Oceanimonas smirnovii]